MNQLTIALPVIRVEFAVDVVQRAKLLPLDTLVLDGVGRGITISDDLAEDFRLSARLIDHCIIRLIEEELLFFNIQTGHLGLTERALALWHKQQLDQLAFRGEPATELFSAFQDLTSGSIVPYGRGSPMLRFGDPSEALVLEPGEVPESVFNLSPIKVAALFNAQPWLTRRSGGERLVALEGHLSNVRRVGHLLVDFAPYRQHGELELWPANDLVAGGSASLHALLARLRQWLHDHPDLWRERFPEAAVWVPEASPQRLFIPFTAFGPLNQWAAIPGHLSDDEQPDSYAAQLRTSCERFRLNAVPLKIVRDAEHVDLCQRLLSETKEYCVIHSAFWSEAGISQYADQIRAALGRGVRIFLMRGLGVEEDPAQAVRIAILEQLCNEAKNTEGELHISPAPHHSHAKFVVIDGRTVLVSSFNFLQATRDNRQLNIGLFASHCPDPEYGIGLAVLRNWTSNTTGGKMLDNLEQQLGRDELLTGPGGTRHESGPTDDRLTTFRTWFGQLHEPLCGWETLTSEAHRDALLIALRTAETSVTITSGDMSASAVDAVLLSYLRAALQRGVRVCLLWGCQARDPAEHVRVSEQAKELQTTLRAFGTNEVML